MRNDEAALAVIDALEAAGVAYMLVGSFSSSYYGIPRSTKDADFVVELGGQSIRVVTDRLGPVFRLDPQTMFETVTMTTRHVVSVVNSVFKIELFHLSDDPHDQERFRRRVRVQTLGREVSLPTAEDVIVTKLRWVVGNRRSKDWEDIQSVISVQGDGLDWDYIYRWSEQHGTRATLEVIRASIPPI